MTEARATSGVVYVASREARFVEEAALSAASMKRAAPGVPVWLFTDQTQCPLVRLDVFDEVRKIESCADFDQPSCNAKIDRLRVLADPPFERCLQLDTDTRIRSDRVRDAFALLEQIDIAMVECHPDSSISRGLYGRPMFNGGLVLFRRNDKTRAMFEDWRALTERHFGLAQSASAAEIESACAYVRQVESDEDRRTLLCRDQLALAQIFSPEVNRHELVYAQLSEAWNHRGMGERRRLPEPAIIDHLNAFKYRTAEDLALEGFMRFRARDHRTATLLYSYVVGARAPHLAEADAASLITEVRSADAQAFGEIAAAAETARSGAPSGPQWLENALRMVAIHVRFGQPRAAQSLGAAIVERARKTATA